MEVYYCNQTNAGLMLLNKMLATGGKPVFNRAEIGSGAPGAPEEIPGLTSLIKKEYDMQIKKSFEDDTGIVQVGVTLDNETITEGFSAKEVGLFLLDESSGEEALFSYTYFVGEGDFIPPGYAIRKVFGLNLHTGVSSAIDVQILTSSGVYATALDLEQHNESATAHEAAFAAPSAAARIGYDNTVSGLEAENVQSALDALQTLYNKVAEDVSKHSAIVISAAEPPDWPDGEWWYEELESESITEPDLASIEITTVAYDGAELFHIDIDGITETMTRVTDNEDGATAAELIII